MTPSTTTISADPNPRPGHHKHYLLIGVSLAFLVLGQVLGKMGAASISLSNFNPLQFLNIFIVLAYTCLILQGLVWVFVVKRFDLSFAYPFMSLSYVIVLILAYIMFDEPLTVMKIGGSVLITIGVALISVGKGKSGKRGEEGMRDVGGASLRPRGRKQFFLQYEGAAIGEESTTEEEEENG